MFNLSLRFRGFTANHRFDGVLCLGALCWAGLLIQVYTPVSWSTGAMLIAFLLLGALLGQLVLFLVVHKIWKLWQQRRNQEVFLAFRSVGSAVIRGYIRALIGELALLSAFALFHSSPLRLLQLITFSFTAITIITTLLTSQYWKQQEKGTAIFNVLCLGFGIQLFFVFLLKLL